MATLFFGDNLNILRESIKDESVDLIYLDPPFNSKRDYNLLFKSPAGQASDAQIMAFEDTWHWTEQTALEFHQLLHQPNTDVAELMQAIRSFLGENDMMAYLTCMAIRLLELHRVLKPTGSLYLHCDPTASHYLKVVLDSVFSPENYRNEITWLRSKNPKGSQYQAKRFSPDTDIILFYAKSSKADLNYRQIKIPLTDEELKIKYDRVDEKGQYTDGPILRSPTMGDRPNLVYEYMNYTPGSHGWRVTREKLIEIDQRGNLGWSTSGKPFRKLRPEEDTGKPIGNCWIDISPINPQAFERLGFPTQKPLALLEKIIQASSREGDVVLDPFCGCGTAVHAAQKLHRDWIGIDITNLAISTIEKRLKDAFPSIAFDVQGTPKDLASAQDLAKRNKYQFQWWACALVNAQPFQGKKKGADTGIDGLIFFQDEANTFKKIIVSVKGGDHVGVSMVRELDSVVNRERAALGLLVTLTPPTPAMRTEANAAGFYHAPHHGDFPKIQILTVEGLLNGSEFAHYPDLARGGLTFRKAAPEPPVQEQAQLL